MLTDSADPMDIRVLLIVHNENTMKQYLNILKTYNIQVFVTSSFLDLSTEICRQTYHGILVDLPTKMAAIRENRDYVYGLIQNFPVLQLRINEKTGELAGFYCSHPSIHNLTDFIEVGCRNFVPRAIRTDERKAIHLNIRLYKHKKDRKPERTVTLNLSRGGCFIFSTRQWETGNEAWMVIQELTDHTFISGEIRNVVKWGETLRIPGIGIEFRTISATQWSEINNRFLNVGKDEQHES